MRRRAQVSDPREFVDQCYRRLLGRPADPAGLEHFVGLLREGLPRDEIVMSIATSAEYRLLMHDASSPRRRRPESYRLAVDLSGSSPFVAFDVRDASDFDWLETAILEDGYYEHAGVWSLEPDLDKRVMGQLLASLGPRRALEIGCSSGTVLRVLRDQGVYAEGVEISRMAHDRALPDIREYIHVGDLLELELADTYDLVFGLDIFEHLNPNRLESYLAAIHERLVPDGWLFANIPAFGHDDVFGEVFPLYVPEWEHDVAAGRCFRVLHCDDDGYPMNGHLIWAHTDWWVDQFTNAGFERQPAVEAELHEKFAEYLQTAPARRSFYAFRTRTRHP